MENIVFNENKLRVAEKDKKVLGVLAINLMTFEHLYLAPDAQYLGIGLKLLIEYQETENKLKLWVFKKINALFFFINEVVSKKLKKQMVRETKKKFQTQETFGKNRK
ncbi:GNAT family N-acetyltransferase [Fluviispira vulneris]|uniref:GNAT family N-acetyltransferase n=1 Tax=Fluviispira vulneris TaxID=2763012 RepID=UPI001645A719|nr:GNAT family N-acetyltransferase [Fluviispira vulneris]